MKVILLQDVKNYGKKGSIVEVNGGYATNYLIPRKLAVIYTNKSNEILQKQNKEREEGLKRQKELALQNKEKLSQIVVEFSAKASPDGRMYGTISYKQIAEKLKEQFDIEIDKRKFIDRYQVNAFGTTKLKIELFKEVIATISVHVTEDK